MSLNSIPYAVAHKIPPTYATRVIPYLEAPLEQGGSREAKKESSSSFAPIAVGTALLASGGAFLYFKNETQALWRAVQSSAASAARANKKAKIALWGGGGLTLASLGHAALTLINNEKVNAALKEGKDHCNWDV